MGKAGHTRPAAAPSSACTSCGIHSSSSQLLICRVSHSCSLPSCSEPGCAPSSTGCTSSAQACRDEISKSVDRIVQSIGSLPRRTLRRGGTSAGVGKLETTPYLSVERGRGLAMPCRLHSARFVSTPAGSAGSPRNGTSRRDSGQGWHDRKGYEVER